MYWMLLVTGVRKREGTIHLWKSRMIILALDLEQKVRLVCWCCVTDVHCTLGPVVSFT
jgi:hypothetical protein